MTFSAEEVRKRFETWASRTYGIARHPTLSDQYAATGVQCAWAAWQGAYATLLEQREAVTQDDVAAAMQAYIDESGIEDTRSGEYLPINDEAMRAALESCASRHARQVPDGFVLVPVKATEKMRQEGAPHAGYEEEEAYALDNVWAAMLAAAPPAPSEEVK